MFFIQFQFIAARAQIEKNVAIENISTLIENSHQIARKIKRF